MKEEIIISGRDLPHIDPHLEVWHWPISVDLFMGGLAAGILFFAAFYTIAGKEKELPTAVKWSTFLAPVAIMIALICLFIDLKHKPYFWQLYTTFRWESPMSLGSWILLLITPLSILWAGSYVRELLPSWDWKFGLLKSLEQWVIHNRKTLAWPMLFLAAGLGIYTGILLSAFNARPLWNTSVLAPLFLTYGLLTGAAAIMWMSHQPDERRLFTKISLVLAGVVIFLIIHLFMGYLAGPAVQVESAALFLGGAFTIPFWGVVVGAGLIVPVMLEILKLRGLKVPLAIPAILFLVGGLVFRFLMVEAGQLARYLY